MESRQRGNWANPVKMGSVAIYDSFLQFHPGTIAIRLISSRLCGTYPFHTSVHYRHPTFASMELPDDLTIDTRTILGLQLPTDPRWVNLAERSLEEILTDHAYCEQKAATSCISLIQRYNGRERLVLELSPIVT